MQCLVGHPFDTLKVRVQAGEPLLAAAGGLRRAGLRGVYSGLTGPLATVPLMNALIFGAYKVGKDLVRWVIPPPLALPPPPAAAGSSAGGGRSAGPAPLGILQLGAAGAFAGLVGCVVTCPVDLVRSRQQLEPGLSVGATIRQIVRQDGLR